MKFTHNPDVKSINVMVTDFQMKKLYVVLDKWRAAFEETGVVGIPPFIAGGAIRDTVLGLAWKDIDIFVPTPKDWDKDDFGVFLTETYRHMYEGTPNFARKSREEYNHGSDREIFSVVAAEGIFDILAVDAETPSAIVETFDHDLCKIFLTAAGVSASEEFLGVLKKGRVQPKNEKESARLSRWRDRTGYSITIGRHPKQQAKTYGDLLRTLAVQPWWPYLNEEAALNHRADELRQFVARWDGAVDPAIVHPARLQPLGGNN